MNGMNAVNAILLLLFASVYAANEMSGQTLDPDVSGEDDKRYAASNKAAGLFPFPRVGRSGGRLVWSVESQPERSPEKRQGLFSFPRVGRSGRPLVLYSTPGASRRLGLEVGKRDSDQGAGMWFGPRLGRREKRDRQPFPWAFLALKEFPGARSREGFTPGLGRDSNEDSEYPNLEDEDELGPVPDLAYQPRPADKSLNKSNQAI